MRYDADKAAAIRGTTEKGECRSHACMTMSEPNSWDLNVVKVLPSPFYVLWIAALHCVLLAMTCEASAAEQLAGSIAEPMRSCALRNDVACGVF